MKLMNRDRILLACFLALLWVPLAAPAGAQEGQFFRGEERERILEDTERLAKIQQRYQDKIMKIEAVLGIGVGLDREKRELVFLVAVDKHAETPDLPREIEGVRVMVERHERDVPLHGAAGGCIQPCHANQLALPVEMGNSAFTVNNCNACTLGFKACDPQTKQTVYVTNAHCSTDNAGCVGAAPAGTNTSHRAPLDAGCAVVSIVGQTIQQVGPNCAVANNTLDCASVDSTAAQTQISIRDIGVPSANPGTVLVGDTVQKSGRTTGWTQGTVASTTWTVTVGPYNCCGNATFVNQIRVNAIGPGPFIQGGDSGSALLNMNDEIVGLLFSGPSDGSAANANQIGTVLAALGLTLDHLECIDCAAEAAAAETREPEGTLATLRKVREGVLKKSRRGQRYVDLFNRFSGEVVAVMARHPRLFGNTVELLQKHLPHLSALVEKGRTTMTREDLEEISRLLRNYAKFADEDLKAALERLDGDLRNAELLQSFGVYVR